MKHTRFFRRGFALLLTSILLLACCACGAQNPNATPAAVPVSVAYATDELLGQYASYASFDEAGAADSSGFARVIFTTTAAVKNFKYLEISFADAGTATDISLSSAKTKTLYSAKTLSPETPVVIGTIFAGDAAPYRGISFTDANNKTRVFYLAQSGQDGTPLLLELT